MAYDDLRRDCFVGRIYSLKALLFHLPRCWMVCPDMPAEDVDVAAPNLRLRVE